MHLDIEPERPADHVAIRDVVRAAFDHHQSVADLVELIRDSPQYVPELSIVARHQGVVVGHVMLSHAELVDERGDGTASSRCRRWPSLRPCRGEASAPL